MYYMRTTLILPDDLINEALKASGMHSKTDVVIAGLKEIIRQGHIKEMEELAGKLRIKVDRNRGRRRPVK